MDTNMEGSFDSTDVVEQLIKLGKVKPEHISYGDKWVKVGALKIYSHDPRYEFAVFLSYFPPTDPIITIGENTIIHPTATIGGRGFGYVRNPYKYELVEMPHLGGVTISKNVFIGERVNIHRGVNNDTFIGRDTKIDYGCHIAHGVQIGEGNTIAALCSIEGSVQIGADNTFGSGVIVQRGVKIGSGNIFGSGTVVVKSITHEGSGIWVGNPARKLEK